MSSGPSQGARAPQNVVPGLLMGRSDMQSWSLLQGIEEASLGFSPTNVNECQPGICTLGSASTWRTPLDAPVNPGAAVTPDEKGCQGTRISALSHPHDTSCSSFPLAHIPELTQHSAAAGAVPTAPATPRPIQPLAHNWHVCPAEAPHRAQWPVSDVDSVPSDSVPHGPLSAWRGSFTCSACESGYWVNEDGTACEGNPGRVVRAQGAQTLGTLPGLSLFPWFGVDARGSGLGKGFPANGLHSGTERRGVQQQKRKEADGQEPPQKHPRGGCGGCPVRGPEPELPFPGGHRSDKLRRKKGNRDLGWFWPGQVEEASQIPWVTDWLIVCPRPRQCAFSRSARPSLQHHSSSPAGTESGLPAQRPEPCEGENFNV